MDTRQMHGYPPSVRAFITYHIFLNSDTVLLRFSICATRARQYETLTARGKGHVGVSSKLLRRLDPRREFEIQAVVGV